jgi:lipopolysaccharide/colanic/teichoic acid biosynthesis glycosyltransferase
VINGCYKSGNGQLRVIDPATDSCHPSETAISWSQATSRSTASCVSRPGMTGPWQVLGDRVPMQEMVAIACLYVSNSSLWLDLKLLLRTERRVLRRGNV